MESEQIVADKSKKIQNVAFKRFGTTAAAIGLLGFCPSYYKAATSGVLWSVSSDKPHTDNDFLIPHFMCMILWLVGVFFQLATGGTPYKRTHRISGYIALLGLFVGMLGAFANIAKYDFTRDAANVWAGIYTLNLIVGAVANASIGLGRAIQKRTKEHKDHMMLAIMWSLDPAVHRFAMWSIRWGSDGNLDPDQLLSFGKLAANFILVTCFGTMIVVGHRVTIINVINIANQYAWYILGASLSLGAFDVSHLVRGWVIGGLCTLTLIVFTLIFIWHRMEISAKNNSTSDACRSLSQA